MPKVLLVLFAADKWTLRDGSTHPTGIWAEEFVAPYTLFTEAGWAVTVATPGGRRPTVDRLSLSLRGGVTPGKIKEMRAALDRLAPVLNSPTDLDTVDVADYDAVFYSGGHGPMEDLAVDEASGALLTEAVNSGKPLALLCHAPAAMLAARNDDGTWPFVGFSMTALSNVEERINPFGWKAPWLLEDRLVEAGADYSKALLPLRPHIVEDRNLLTGQNPASSAPLAERLIARVDAQG